MTRTLTWLLSLSLMAHMGLKEGLNVSPKFMLFALPSCKKKIAVSTRVCEGTSVHRPCASKSISSNSAKASLSRRNILQALAILGIIMFEAPLVMAGSSSTDKERSNGFYGPRTASDEDVVLHGQPYTARLVRPHLSLLEDEMEEILYVKLTLLHGKASAFRVFINLPNANEETPITRHEFSSSYAHEPRRVTSPDYEYQTTVFRVGISSIIEELGLMSEPSILVTFVPCGADKELPVVLGDLHIEVE